MKALTLLALLPIQLAAAQFPQTPAQQVNADAGVQKYTAADVSFMQGMIHHHSQALIMAGWAQTHGASEEVKTLAGRIDVGQRDEITFMKRWLADRHQAVPEIHDGHDMPNMSMPDSLMPGMLNAQQMAQLDAARGKNFDDLFLRFMMQHHSGALTMVNRLFATPGAAQEEYVFRFATDVSTDQTTEIERMQGMLAATSPQSTKQ
ncbi:MAG TPA: DUF305 domain-containing protein [Gemmatimonadaceae bacterium]|nr:DUF305 domain-containing protein [Gemmatimonadaceae bacterium]